MTYKIAIQAVPERLEKARGLESVTGGEITLHIPGDQSDETYIRLLRSIGDADYLVRLEDDALLAPDFFDALDYGIQEMKRQNFQVLMLYTNKTKAMKLCPKEGHIVFKHHPLNLGSGVGLVYERKIIEPFIQFYKTRPCPCQHHIYGNHDTSLGMYLDHYHLRMGVITPNIVQHHDEGISYLGHSWKTERYSKSFRSRYGF